MRYAMLRTGRVFLALWLSLSLCAPTVHAQDPTGIETPLTFRMLELPQFTLRADLDLACYDFDGAKALAEADREFSHLKVELEGKAKREALLTEQLQKLNGYVVDLEKDYAAQSDDTAAALALAATAEKKLDTLSKRPPIPVVVLIVALTALAGFGVGVPVGLSAQ